MGRHMTTTQFDDLARVYEATAVETPVRKYLECPSYKAAVGDLTGKTVLGTGCPSGIYTRRLDFTVTLAGRTVSLTAYRWSRATQDQAALDAGFRDLTWIGPHVTGEGIRRHGKQYWRQYLGRPRALILDRIAEPADRNEGTP
jgi:hypothetical protein